MKAMRYDRIDGYSAALILSEGRYEKRERYLESVRPDIQIEPLNKSEWIRVSPLVVKRLSKV